MEERESELHTMCNRESKEEASQGRYSWIGRGAGHRINRHHGANNSTRIRRQRLSSAHCGRRNWSHAGLPNEKKNEVAKVILLDISKLELAVGKTLKRYDSDNAKEQRTKALMDELKTKGTKISSAAPNSSQQNAIVERRFGTLFAATKKDLLKASSRQLNTKEIRVIGMLGAIDKANFFTPLKIGICEYST